MARIAAFTVLLMAAGPAAAQTAWIAAPTVADMAAAYPAKAKAEGIGGGVEMVCSANRNGGLDNCDVLAESPRGYGFGGAAKTLAKQLRGDGLINGAEVRVPVTFLPAMAKGGVVTVRTPHWTALPSLADLQTAAPKSEGGPNEVRVTLVCDVQAGGSLSGCSVDREEPAGHGFGPAILALAAIVAFFPIFSGAATGLRSADPDLERLFALYGANRWQTVMRLRLPSALPFLLEGHKVGAGLALIGAVVAEFSAGTGGVQGLAWQILDAGNKLQIAREIAALVVLAAMGVALHALLEAAERTGLRWWRGR
jgi:TonB family protein